MPKVPAWIEEARAAWQYRGQERPDFAIEPGPGQKSVWDFPRPPLLEAVSKTLRVVRGEKTLAETTQGMASYETAHPPTFYFPPDDVDRTQLQAVSGTTVCEWKGAANYYDLLGDTVLSRHAWMYPRPFPGWEPIASYVAFMPENLECYVGDELIRPQPGGFYGGWITSELVGPFKGEPGVSG